LLAEHDLGVFVLGTTGEGPSVPLAMRQRLVAITVAAAGHRVPVLAGIGENCAAASVEAAHAYLRLKVDAVVAQLPSYYQLNPVEMETYFRSLAHAVAGQLMLYNIPVTTRMSVPVDVVERLSAISNVVGFKDSEAGGDRPEQVAAALRGQEGFSIFMGVAAQATRAMQLGFDGSVPSSGNLAPQIWRDLQSAARSGDWARAQALQTDADAVGALYQGPRSLGQSLAALKAAMSELGLCEPHMLPPLLAAGSDEIASLREQVRTLPALATSR
jgi:2-dehydro-3-deoxy-D-pentonate aldolase